jgi:hypothetical protein
VRSAVKALADWIDENIRAYPYGEIRATVKIHDGKISLIERSATERIKPGTPGGVRGRKA